MRRASLPPAACRVSDTLIARGHHGVIVSRPESPAPAREHTPVHPRSLADRTARALGVEVGAVSESMVFLLDDDPILLVVSAGHRVHLERTGERLEGTLTPASPELVGEVTGQDVDAVAPVGHPANLPTWVDVALSRHREVWAAGGHPETLFRTSYRELMRITAGLPLDVD